MAHPPFSDKSIRLGEHLWQKYRPPTCLDCLPQRDYLKPVLKALAQCEAMGLCNHNGVTVTYFGHHLPRYLN